LAKIYSDIKKISLDNCHPEPKAKGLGLSLPKARFFSAGGGSE
jgi:hypothetical protein